MVRKYLDQKTQNRNFDARNERAASEAFRRKRDDRSNSEDGKQGDCNLKHDLSKKGKGKGKRDGPCSLSLGPRSPRSDSKDVKIKKEKSSKTTVRRVRRSTLSVTATGKESAGIRPVIIGTLANVSDTRRMKAASLATNVRFFTQQTAKCPTKRQKTISMQTMQQLLSCILFRSGDVYLRMLNHCQTHRLDLRT